MRIQSFQPRREHITPSQGASFKVNAFRTTHWPFNWHDHGELELTAIIQGSGLRYVGDNVEPFQAGDVCLLGAFVPHTWTSAPIPEVTSQSIVAQFLPDTIQASLVEGQDIQQLSLRAQRGIAFTGASAVHIRIGLSELRNEADPLTRLMELWKLLQYCARVSNQDWHYLASESYARPTIFDQRLSTVMALIHDHATDELDVETAAVSVDLGVEGFCRWFRKRTGRTFVIYRNAVRVSFARRQLQGTTDTITDIAFAVGFGSLAQFNRSFLAEVGMNPREFRRQVRPD